MDATRMKSAIGFAAAFFLGAVGAAAEKPSLPGGELRILGADRKEAGSCPLEHTEVVADIIGFVSRVQVRQTFHNPLVEKIEAVYVFPLPENAAVDEMVMYVGERKVVGEVMPREEARRTYERARAAGHVAGLLDQERPNIFTQSVANIEPGARVVIEISYVETLKHEDGFFEFVFPMVVGPRYIPGQPTSRIAPVAAELKGKVHELDKTKVREGRSEPRGTGWSPDTIQVPDASRITPPVVKPGFRAGHDISITVYIDSGMDILDVESKLHEIDVEEAGPGCAAVTLKDLTEIPNRDFILRYTTSTDEIEDAFLVHSDERGTFFTLILQPPRRVPPGEAMPKEMIFVIDRSGSMRGFPIGKAKETMRLCIEGMNPRDTFNLLSFSGGTGRCFERPVPNTPQNRATALGYLEGLHGSGGTEMMKAIRAALGGPSDPERVRIVCFMTDGYIGNDFAIIDAIKKNVGTARVFAFGVGNAVNRFLLDGMAHAGRGEVEYVTLKSGAEGAAERFSERIDSPVLTDIEIDWGTLSVQEVYPRRFPDLFSSKPIMIHGRLTGTRRGAITLRGRTGAGAFEREVYVGPPGGTERREALASLWARAKVKHLMMQDYAGLQRGKFPEDLRKQVTALGIEYRLMTQFTSFVAVEERIVTEGGEPKKITVPVEMPQGVSHWGVFGDIPLGGTGGVTYVGVGGGAAGSFGYRHGGGRKKCVARFGGTCATESSVEKGLRWLARHQEPDGRWDAEKYGGGNTDPAVTGLATLAFLGAGYTQSVGKYKAFVRKAIDWIISQQDNEGCIGRGFDGGLGYHHAICGLALAENYGMTREKRVGEAAQKAVNWSITKHQCEYSGWGKDPKKAPETSVTGWFVMQLKSAKIAGLNVDGAGFQGAINWLDKVTAKPGGRVSSRVGAESTVAMTAAAMLARQLMGWDRTGPLLRGGADWLKTSLPEWEEPDFYYWYAGTLVMFQMGDDCWKEWNAAMKGVLVLHHRKGGDEDGSWDPAGPMCVDGGRASSTALGAMCLEVYYRYLPIYK